MKTLFSAILLLPLACGDKDSGDDTVADTTEPQIDQGNPYCEDLDLPWVSWIEADQDWSLYATAGDVTLSTTEGEITLSEHWSGCDSYLFLQDQPAQATGWPKELWQRDVNDLYALLPRNTQVFFLSTQRQEEDREASFDLLLSKYDDAMEDLSEEDRAWWASHTHFVTERAGYIEGWLGEIMQDPGWGAAIDRFQRVRYIGSYADYNRYNSSYGWFEPNLGMAANEAIYYNFEAERQAALDSRETTVVPIFSRELISDSGWSGNRTYADITLPSAAEMADFDTLEFDLYLGCEGEGEYGTCPAWDYLVYLYQCDLPEVEDNPWADTACTAGESLECSCEKPWGEAETQAYLCNEEGTGYADCSCACGTEVGRWITTYHREGRWVHDLSSLLPLYDSGGTRRFSFYSQQPYEVDLDIRLSHSGKESRATALHYLYSGAGFGESYNDNFEAVEIEIPAGTDRVEVASVISGHGMSDPGNCAEFCDTSHHFTVNGVRFDRSFPEASTAQDCMDKAASGTVPNQYGTWWYGRSGWCPGREVPLVTADVTAAIVEGTNTVDYEGFYNGQPYTGGGASIRLSSWLVLSELQTR